MSSDDPIGLLDRITIIFDTLSDDDRDVGVSELAVRSGLPKSTVSRLVSSLVSRHYLERDGTAIRLGLRLFELGQLAETPRALRRVALPVMAALRNSTRGNVELVLLDRGETVHVAVARGVWNPSIAGHIGDRSDAAGSTLGRAILERATTTEVAAVTASSSVAVPRIVRVAAPLLSPSEDVEAALSITVPAENADLAQLRATVEAAAMAICRRL